MDKLNKKEYNKRYDKNKRDKQSKKIYNSKDWQRVRERVLTYYNYLCRDCLYNKKITPYNVVHHVKELKDYPELAFVESNLVPLCHACHNKTHSSKRTKKESNIKVDHVKMEANQELI